MSSKKSCHHVTLARNEVAHVQRCVECGSIAVHLGPVTVRLDERTLGAVLGVLGEATAQLARQQVWPPRDVPQGLA